MISNLPRITCILRFRGEEKTCTIQLGGVRKANVPTFDRPRVKRCLVGQRPVGALKGKIRISVHSKLLVVIAHCFRGEIGKKNLNITVLVGKKRWVDEAFVSGPGEGDNGRLKGSFQLRRFEEQGDQLRALRPRTTQSQLSARGSRQRPWHTGCALRQKGGEAFCGRKFNWGVKVQKRGHLPGA